MVRAPLGTYTGWNLRGRGHGEGYMHEFTGSYIPFPETDEVKQAIRDSRPSVKDRYMDSEGYVRAVRMGAENLLQESLMLDEDMERVVVEARNWSWLLRESGL